MFEWDWIGCVEQEFDELIVVLKSFVWLVCIVKDFVEVWDWWSVGDSVSGVDGFEIVVGRM